MKKLAIFLASLLLLITCAFNAKALPQYTGFTTRAQGYVVQNTDWNGEFGNLISFINTNVIGSLNLVIGKGYLLSSDGTNPVQVPNAGASDSGKFLQFNNSGTGSGLSWASLVSGVTALTTLGDTLVYGPSGITRLPAGANGTVLTSDNTQVNGIAFEPGGVPSGTITLWYGAVNTIPTGWSLCNGQTTTTGLQTPNLQGVYVLGAGNTSPAASNGYGLYSPNTQQGATSLSQSFSVSGYTSAGIGNQGCTTGSTQASSYAHVHSFSYSGSTVPSTFAPASLALCYIMKN